VVAGFGKAGSGNQANVAATDDGKVQAKILPRHAAKSTETDG
jgi:hypothetical protein